jgi:anti-sigma factor RsiW
MLTCKTFDPLITPYIDGEIADADRRAVEEHLRACPPCDSRVAAERVVHELVRARTGALRSTRAPESLRSACSRIAADARAVPASVAPTWRRRLTPYGLAASLVVVVGGAFVYQATDRSDRVMAAELAADHLRCFAMNSVFGTHHAAPAVESSIAASFGWHTHFPEDRAGGQLELVDGRPCLYGKGKVAHIMYRHQGHPVSLFMLPDTVRARDLVEVFGHEAAIWCSGNRTFVLVARESKPEVQRLASFVQAGLR